MSNKVKSQSSSGSPESDGKPRGGRARRVIKWLVFIIALVFFLSVLREAFDPFGGDPYLEISHGDHVHYVPQDRDPNVPVGRFPTTEPADDERITPDGRIVKKSQE